MENYSYIFGLAPTGLFIAELIFALIGMLMALLGDAQTRDQNSISTPQKFSFWFLIKDNWKTIILSLLAVLITLRFAPLLFSDQFTTESLDKPLGKEKWLLGSFFIGLAFNGLLQFLKDKSAILKVRK